MTGERKFVVFVSSKISQISIHDNSAVYYFLIGSKKTKKSLKFSLQDFLVVVIITFNFAWFTEILQQFSYSFLFLSTI